MIRLWDGYAVYADERNVVLGKPIAFTDKDGQAQMRYDRETFHTNLASALREFHRIQTRRAITETDMTLARAITVMENIEKRIRDLAKEQDLTDERTE